MWMIGTASLSINGQYVGEATELSINDNGTKRPFLRQLTFWNVRDAELDALERRITTPPATFGRQTPTP